jgi:hypothetical protein
MMAGLALTLIVRMLLVALRLEAFVRPRSLFYPCLIMVFTLAAWLLFFKN